MCGDVEVWMGNKRFQPNPSKAKRLWDIPGSEEASSLVLDGVALYQIDSVCNLGNSWTPAQRISSSLGYEGFCCCWTRRACSFSHMH